jgi:hypothetical protein
MIRLKIVGQAPARSGDGRPFTGSSGQRLCHLFGLMNYEALASRFDLMNLLDHTVEQSASGRGDTFDRATAIARAHKMILYWVAQGEVIPVLACGHDVFKCLTGVNKPFFSGKSIKLSGHLGQVDVWCFPHPSGASAFWNNASNWNDGQYFLKRLVKRYGINMT